MINREGIIQLIKRYPLVFWKKSGLQKILEVSINSGFELSIWKKEEFDWFLFVNQEFHIIRRAKNYFVKVTQDSLYKDGSEMASLVLF